MTRWHTPLYWNVWNYKRPTGHQESSSRTPWDCKSQLTIKCCEYAPSPLLFCVSLNTLSHIITKTGHGYQFWSGATISHLLYMDDIKLYAKNEQEIHKLIHTIRIYSTDIGILFRLDKCGWMVSKTGRMIWSEGVDLPDCKIEDIQDNPKYCTLGFHRLRETTRRPPLSQPQPNAPREWDKP